MVGLLDIAIDLLDIPDVDIEFEIQQEEVRDNRPNRIEIEVEAIDGAEDDQVVLEEQLAQLEEVLEQHEALLEQEEEEEEARQQAGEQAGERGDEAAPAPRPERVVADDAAPPPVIRPAAPPPEPAAQPAGNVHWDLGTALLGLSSAVTADLLLPVFAATAGELLRLVLPKRLTTMPSGNFTGRVGLLQQVWGRSLAGGALYIVFRDFFRFYVKYRRAEAKSYRRVQNYDREKGRGDRPAARRP